MCAEQRRVGAASLPTAWPNLNQCRAAARRYEEGANVSSLDELVAAAEQLGLPGAEVRQHLEADAGRSAVLEDDAYGKRE